MSVIVKGMKMPKACFDCIFYEGLECSLTGFDADRKDRHCPLVELPPHGDLISREWLIDIALHLMNTAKNDDIANGVKWLWRYIVSTPTIIEAEGEE